MARPIFFLVLIFLCAEKSSAQSAFAPLDEDWNAVLQHYEMESNHISDELHFSQLPLSRENIVAYLDSIRTEKISLQRIDRRNLQYFLVDNDEWSNDSSSKSRKPFLKYFYRDPATFYQYRSQPFLVKINPVFDFEAGRESASNEWTYLNSRGLDVRGWIDQKVGFYFFLTENQARYPLFVRQRIDSLQAVPGETYYKNLQDGGVDFFQTKGYFDFTVAKYITIQFGQDQNFFGNGIRSLFLSNESGDYIFLKLQVQVWKISYSTIFTDLTSDYLRTYDHLLPSKYAAFHHLSVNATKFLNAGVFESVIFHRENGFDIRYLNPIIFYRSIEQGLGSPDNTTLGVDARAVFLHHFTAYGQFLLDDLNVAASKEGSGYWGDKFGYQFGLKYTNMFGIAMLDGQVEWNHIRPYTYTHNDSVANYTHYNQPLAHPMGANLNEWIISLRYQPVFPLVLDLKFFSVKQGADSTGTNFGANIFEIVNDNNVPSLYGNKTTQGIPSQLYLWQGTASYQLRHNLFIDLVVYHRTVNSKLSSLQQKDNGAQLGIRYNLALRTFNF